MSDTPTPAAAPTTGKGPRWRIERNGEILATAEQWSYGVINSAKPETVVDHLHVALKRTGKALREMHLRADRSGNTVVYVRTTPYGASADYEDSGIRVVDAWANPTPAGPA